MFSISNIKSVIIKSTANYTSHWIILLFDLFFLFQTFLLSYYLRFDFHLNFEKEGFLIASTVMIIASGLIFSLVGSHKGVIRHTGERDVFNILIAQFFTTVFLFGLVHLNRALAFFPAFDIPMLVLAIHFFLSVFVLSIIRFSYKIIYYKVRRSKHTTKRVLIFGAGYMGSLAHKVLSEDQSQIVKVLGFVDDDSKKVGKKVQGIRVYSAKEVDEKFVKTYDIDEVIVAVNNLNVQRLRKIVDSVSEYKIKLSKVPKIDSWNDTPDFSVNQIKKIKIEDLLDRPPILIESDELNNQYSNKIVIVTGAAGSIGSEICKQIIQLQPSKLILIDIAESALYEIQQEFVLGKFENFKAIVADIRDDFRMEQIFDEYKPDIVFHAAAYKHVPLMEENPYEAIKINVLGTKCLADLSIKFGVERFVMVSTDKAVNPTNVMGASKRIAEKYVTSLKNNNTTKFITTRFGNVLGSNGSVIPLFRRQLENGGPLTVTHPKITRYFMTIPEACQLVLQAGSMGDNGQILIFDMGESVKIFDLAKRMIQLSGYSYPEEIDIVFTGLRSGEKLYEELLNNKENTLPTYHPKIMIGKVDDTNSMEIRDSVCALKTTIYEKENVDLVRIMKELVPEFKSQNSEFETLDTV
jgi:FlaA1/EpsC-like NDP-sugar epimerase